MTLVLGIGTNLLDDTLDKTLGECFEAIPWTEHFIGSTFVKKCPGGIAPNRLEADGVYESSPKRVNCMQLNRIRLEIFLMPPSAFPGLITTRRAGSLMLLYH